MKSKIEILRKLARILFEMLFVMCISIFFELFFFTQEPALINRIILVVLYMLSFIIREKYRVPIYAIVFHGLMGLVLLIVPIDLAGKVINIVIAYFLCMTSITYIRLGNKPKPLDDAPWPTFSVILLMYFLAIYKKCYSFMNYTYVFVFLMLVIYYFINYLEGLVKYIDSSNDVEEKHLKRVISRNNKIVFLVVILLVVSMVIGCVLDYHKLETAVMGVLKGVLKLVVSLCVIFGLLFENIMRETSNSANAFDAEAMGQMKYYAKEAGNSLEIILYAALAGICIVILVKFTKFAVKLLLSKNKHHDDVVEKAEKIVEYNVENKKKTIFKRLSDEDKLRKKYKEYIEQFKHDIRLTNTRTSRDIAEEINNCDLGEVTEITEIYSQIRYGNRETDRKLLKKVSSLCKSKYH